jgi:hypothetical protein
VSVRESASESQVGLQFSVYPLRQEHLHPAIEAAVQAAAKQGVEVTVGRLSTFAPGRRIRSSPLCGLHLTRRGRSDRPSWW